ASNKEHSAPDVAYFTGGLDPASNAETLVRHDQEFHTSFWGHLGLLGLTSHVLIPGYAGYVNTAAASLYPTNAEVADLGRAQGAIAGYVHPLDWDPGASVPRRALSSRAFRSTRPSARWTTTRRSASATTRPR